MELAETPTQQLLELQRIIKEELRRRRPEEVLRKRMALKHKLKEYDRERWLSDKIPNAKAARHNAKHLLAIRPSDLVTAPNQRVKYLKMLLKQDWSHLFSCCPGEQNYYVYGHCDPRETPVQGPTELNGVTPGLPFYVGKGIGGRAWDMKRNQGHGLKLKEVLAAGYKPTQLVHIFDKGLSESRALELEAKLVYFFGTIYEEKRSGVLLNLDLCKRPEFVGFMEKLLTPKQIAKARAARIIGSST